MTKEELKEKLTKDIKDHKTEKFFRLSDYKPNKEPSKKNKSYCIKKGGP